MSLGLRLLRLFVAPPPATAVLDGEAAAPPPAVPIQAAAPPPAVSVPSLELEPPSAGGRASGATAPRRTQPRTASPAVPVAAARVDGDADTPSREASPAPPVAAARVDAATVPPSHGASPAGRVPAPVAGAPSAIRSGRATRSVASPATPNQAAGGRRLGVLPRSPGVPGELRSGRASAGEVSYAPGTPRPRSALRLVGDLAAAPGPIGVLGLAAVTDPDEVAGPDQHDAPRTPVDPSVADGEREPTPPRRPGAVWGPHGSANGTATRPDVGGSPAAAVPGAPAPQPGRSFAAATVQELRPLARRPFASAPEREPAPGPAPAAAPEPELSPAPEPELSPASAFAPVAGPQPAPAPEPAPAPAPAPWPATARAAIPVTTPAPAPPAAACPAPAIGVGPDLAATRSSQRLPRVCVLGDTRIAPAVGRAVAAQLARRHGSPVLLVVVASDEAGTTSRPPTVRPRPGSRAARRLAAGLPDGAHAVVRGSCVEAAAGLAGATTEGGESEPGVPAVADVTAAAEAVPVVVLLPPTRCDGDVSILAVHDLVLVAVAADAPAPLADLAVAGVAHDAPGVRVEAVRLSPRAGAGARRSAVVAALGDPR